MAGFYTDRFPERNAELEKCREMNSKNALLDKIVLFLEDCDEAQARASSPALSSPKFQLIQKLMEKSNSLAQQDAKTIVNTIFSSMIQALAKGERIEIRGFGNFTVRSYQSYQGRNPRTGTKVQVAPKKLPFFKVGKELKERVDLTPAPPEG